jgi:signal peptidase II
MAISAFNLTTALAVAALSWGVDRFSKLYILDTLSMSPGDALTVIPGILTFVMTWNYGINFGILASEGGLMKMALSALAVIVSIVLLVWAARHPRDGIFAVAVGLIVGGALGNGYDRQVYGAVADFLNVTCCGIRNPFAFNIADVTIFLGVAILLLRPSAEATR